jgi:predicted transcriptional regulator
LIAGIHPDRPSKEILFDPLVEDWAFAGISEEYRDWLKQKKECEEERAILLDRLRWVAQKRLQGKAKEIFLLYLAGCSQVSIAESLGVSRSTVRRSLIESGESLKRVVSGTTLLKEGFRKGTVEVKLLPLDSEEDLTEFAEYVRSRQVHHIALGTFADLREALVVSG